MSWRQYGGTNKPIINTVNAGYVVANQFLTRNTSANLNQFDNVKVNGQLNVLDFIHGATYVKADQTLISQNLSLKPIFLANQASLAKGQ
jgi:hypothetical protein